MADSVDTYRDQDEYPKLGLTQWSTWMTRLDGGASPTDVDFCLHKALPPVDGIRQDKFLEIEFKPMRDGLSIPGTKGQLRALWAKAAVDGFTVWIVEDTRNREKVMGARDRNEMVRVTKCLSGGGEEPDGGEMITIAELDRRISEWWDG